ncbi:hypothetical protein D9M72_472870 [compost metagenome]
MCDEGSVRRPSLPYWRRPSARLRCSRSWMSAAPSWERAPPHARRDRGRASPLLRQGSTVYAAGRGTSVAVRGARWAGLRGRAAPRWRHPPPGQPCPVVAVGRNPCATRRLRRPPRTSARAPPASRWPGYAPRWPQTGSGRPCRAGGHLPARYSAALPRRRSSVAGARQVARQTLRPPRVRSRGARRSGGQRRATLRAPYRAGQAARSAQWIRRVPVGAPAWQVHRPEACGAPSSRPLHRSHASAERRLPRPLGRSFSVRRRRRAGLRAHRRPAAGPVRAESPVLRS